MFTVEFPDNLVVKVKFQHFTIHPNNPKKRRFMTRCFFRIFGDGQFLLNVVGDAKCNPTDKVNRNMGKRTALENAMYYFSNGLVANPGERVAYEDITKYLNKEQRKIVWNKFFEVHPLI